jgi:hypothetical protein
MPYEHMESVSLCISNPTGLPPLDGPHLLLMTDLSRLLLIAVRLINSCIGDTNKHSDTIHCSTGWMSEEGSAG